jgi:hypothetical protein
MLGRRSERGAVAGSGGRGKGGKEEREKSVAMFLSSLSIHPFLFLPLSPFKGVHRRSDAELCPVEDEWGEEKNVPGWNKRCVKLCVLTLALTIIDLFALCFCEEKWRWP